MDLWLYFKLDLVRVDVAPSSCSLKVCFTAKAGTDAPI